MFYPKDLPQHRELEYASRQLPTIELNGSFYSMQRPASWQHWYEQTPKGFEPVVVELGAATSGRVVIKSGLAAGDVIALRDPTRAVGQGSGSAAGSGAM